MLCRVEMPANEQIYGRFYRYRLFHGVGSNKMMMLLLPIVVIVAVAMMLGAGTTQTNLLISGALVLLVIAYFGYSLYYKPLQMFRKRSGAAMMTEVTILTENGLNRTVKSEEGGPPETNSVQYSALHHAVETGKDFYLFTAPTQAYLLDKEFFTKGDPAELRTALEAKMGVKFHYPGKKKPPKKKK